MPIRVIDHLSDPSAACNEDLAGWTPNAAWVADGATGLSDRRWLPGASDAAWYVAALDRALRRRLQGPRALEPALRDAIAEAAAAMGRESSGRFEAFEVPSAGIMLARATAGRLEWLGLGDCRLIAGTGGRTMVHGRSALDDLDRDTAAEIRKLHNAGIRRPAEVFQRLLPLVRAQRARMNRPGGYWVASRDPRAAAQGDSGDLLPDGPVLLVSDGFYRLVDVFGRHSPNTLLAAARRDGLAPLLADLRALEAADADCLEAPRLKARDDATALLIEVIRPT